MNLTSNNSPESPSGRSPMQCPFYAKGDCREPKVYKGPSWFIRHLNVHHRGKLEDLDFSTYFSSPVSSPCEYGRIHLESKPCTCRGDPQPPVIEDISGRKGRVPVSYWVTDEESTQWAIEEFGQDWEHEWVEFLVTGLEEDDDSMWSLTYPNRDLDDDYLPDPEVRRFLVPDDDAKGGLQDNLGLGTEGSQEEEKEASCSTCKLPTTRQRVCTRCGVPFHSQCGTLYMHSHTCFPCFDSELLSDPQAVSALFRTYKGNNMFDTDAILKALTASLAEAKLEPGPLLPCFQKASHALIKHIMSTGTQGDWWSLSEDLKTAQATKAWKEARRSFRFSKGSSVPPASRPFYDTLTRTVNTALTFQTHNERISTESLHLNESSPEELTDDDKWGEVADLALTAHGLVEEALSLARSPDSDPQMSTLISKLQSAARFALLAHERAQDNGEWGDLKDHVQSNRANLPPEAKTEAHGIKTEKISGVGGHCLYRCVEKVRAELRPDDGGSSIQDLRHATAAGALSLGLQLKAKFVTEPDDVAVRALTGENGQGEELFLLGRMFDFNPIISFPYSQSYCNFEVGDDTMQGFKRCYLIYHGIHCVEEGKDTGHYDILSHEVSVDGKTTRSYLFDPQDNGLSEAVESYLKALRSAGRTSAAAQDLEQYNVCMRARIAEQTSNADRKDAPGVAVEKKVTWAPSTYQDANEAPQKPVHVCIEGLNTGKKKFKKLLTANNMTEGILQINKPSNGKRTAKFTSLEKARAFITAFNERLCFGDGTRAKLVGAQDTDKQEAPDSQILQEVKKLASSVSNLESKINSIQNPPPKSASEQCRTFKKKGWCDRTGCKFKHGKRTTNPHTKKAQFADKVAKNKADKKSDSKTQPQSPTPPAKHNKVCKYYVQGKCTFGKNCRFSHVDCRDFSRGKCNRGGKCRFAHPQQQ